MAPSHAVADPLGTLVAALDRHGCRPRRKSARCPAHDDRNPSLTFSENDNGDALVHCHAGCTVEHILDALGLELRDLFVSRATYRRRRKTHDPLIVNVLGRHVPAPAKSADGVDVPPLPDELRAVLTILHGHAFFAPTCCPSQELIGAECEEVIGRPLSQPTVHRIVKRLRALGLITWRYERTPGARFYHCVYTLLAAWHRPLRRAVIARIQVAKIALAFGVNTERTARNVVKTEERFQRAAGTPVARVRGAPRAKSPPTEADWSRAFESLKMGRDPTCAIFC